LLKEKQLAEGRWKIDYLYSYPTVSRAEERHPSGFHHPLSGGSKTSFETDAEALRILAKIEKNSERLKRMADLIFLGVARDTSADEKRDLRRTNIVSNFKSSIEGFSATVHSIIRNFFLEKEICKMGKNSQFMSVFRKFC
jgi:hypothetical protein